MENYLFIKLVHIVSSVLLFGTGLGSAYYMFMTFREQDLNYKYLTIKNVVKADWLFTTPTVIVQPVTGYIMLREIGFSLEDSWLLWSLVLYVVAGLCWLPVVYMQIKMRDILKVALYNSEELTKEYFIMEKLWTTLGAIAFPCVVIIFYLMVVKP